MTNKLRNTKITRDEKAWEVEVSAEIPAEVLAKYREEALKEMQREASLDGFRPGKAPIERIIQIYGESAVLRHAAQHAIEHELPELLAAEKLLIIESPRVTTDDPIRQLAEGKSLKFSARAALAPQVELPDYKKIAKKITGAKEEVSVSNEEHEQALVHLRRERARIDKIEAGADAKKAAEEAKALAEADLPALDDAFVQSLGYESAEKFSEALRANIKTEKEMQAAERRRAAMLDELVKGSKIDYPAALREYELDDMEARLKEDLSRMGMTMEGYLANMPAEGGSASGGKKTRDEVRADWKDAGDKRAKVRLILTEIARKEKIEPDQETLESELDHAKKRYPQANAEALRAHIRAALRNEATLRMLEGNTEPVAPTEHSHEH